MRNIIDEFELKFPKLSRVELSQAKLGHFNFPAETALTITFFGSNFVFLFIFTKLFTLFTRIMVFFVKKAFLLKMTGFLGQKLVFSEKTMETRKRKSDRQKMMILNPILDFRAVRKRSRAEPS